MQSEVTKKEYDLVKKQLITIQPDVDDSHAMKKALVGSQTPAYQFNFNDDNQTGHIEIANNTYPFIITKSYYNQLIIMLTKPINNNDRNQVKKIKTTMVTNGIGLINIEAKILLPSINLALQETNFKISAPYLNSQLDYEHKTITIQLSDEIIFTINWKFGFYVHSQTGSKHATQDLKLRQFPLSDLLEVSKIEYDRLTELTKQVK